MDLKKREQEILNGTGMENPKGFMHSQECQQAERRNASRAGLAVRSMAEPESVPSVLDRARDAFASPGARRLRASIALACAAMAASCAGVDIIGSAEVSDDEGMIRATEYEGRAGALPWSAKAEGCIVTTIGDPSALTFIFEGQRCTVMHGQGEQDQQGEGNGRPGADVQDEEAEEATARPEA